MPGTIVMKFGGTSVADAERTLLFSMSGASTAKRMQRSTRHGVVERRRTIVE